MLKKHSNSMKKTVTIYEILQEAMEQGLRMNGWGMPNLEYSYDGERYDRLKKIVIVNNNTSRRY